MKESEARPDTSIGSSLIDQINIAPGSVEIPLLPERPDSGFTLELALESGQEAASSSRPGAAATDALDWRDEVSQRVEKFRKKRHNPRHLPEPSLTFDFDFDTPETAQEPLPEHPKGSDSVRGPAIEGVEVRRQTTDGGRVVTVGTLPGAGSPMEKAEVRMKRVPQVKIAGVRAEPSFPRYMEPRAFPGVGVGVDEWASGLAFTASSPLADAESFDDALNAEFEGQAGLEQEAELGVAPVGRRSLAGLIDAGVLILCGAMFAAVFWRTGGHFARTPVTVGTFAFIGLVMMVTYFGLFTALSGATPGLAALGMRISRSDGGVPTFSESILRAAGYAFSTGALMLGFIWAAVDGDELTWHDRMSGTFVTASGFPCTEDETRETGFGGPITGEELPI